MYNVKINDETKSIEICKENGQIISAFPKHDIEKFINLLPFVYNSARIDTIEDIKDFGNVCVDTFDSSLKELYPYLDQNTIDLVTIISRNTVNKMCDKMIDDSCNKGIYKGR